MDSRGHATPDVLRPDVLSAVRDASTLARVGRVTEAFGTTIRVTGIEGRIGQLCDIVDAAGNQRLTAEIVGLSGGVAILTPLGPLQGLTGEAEVFVRADRGQVPVDEAMLGRVVDGHGQPLDGRGPLPADVAHRPIYAPAPNPLERTPIDQRFETGVRAIDLALTLGVGQRLGIFATAGVGKSTLLGMLARHGAADVTVIALVGERGREVREFLDHCLGAHGLARAVVVVATSDRPAMERVRAAHAATAIAEGFRAQGRRVLFLMDSVTRFARALREIGLSVGEPPVRRGFPPSVFAELPRLFERTGNDAAGSITAFYTVLVEDEDGRDPIGEEVRSILDGHIVLTRKLAQANHYPAIALPDSVSRLFQHLTGPNQQAATARLRAWLAKYADVEFLIQVGEYQAGSDPLADEAIAKWPQINDLLRQPADTHESFADALAKLQALAA